MSLTDFLSLCLGCLAATAILACFFAVRTTLRRGKRTRPVLLCPMCLTAHQPACQRPGDRELMETLRYALLEQEALKSGSSSPSARTAAPPTAATTASSTTPETGGSPTPAWVAPAGLLPSHQRPAWSDAMCTGIPEEDGITPCGLTGSHDEHLKRHRPRKPLQHNPGNGVAGIATTPRPSTGTRGEFGMCDYPD